jgi:hypothetical protein
LLPLQVEAEEVDDVTEQYGVTTVPYFVFLQARKQLPQASLHMQYHRLMSSASLHLR